MINEYQPQTYCKEDISKIENYDKAVADTTQTWHCHHRTEIWWNCTAQDLIDNECYYHRKACELIFLTPAEHISLHHKGKSFTDEHKRKLSASMKDKNKGRTSPFKGKSRSDKIRLKISESMKGKEFTAEHKRKLSEAHKGKRRAPFSEETRRKLSEAAKLREARKRQ